jgi:glycosyltransferase involved in cell wall biosynthesis
MRISVLLPTRDRLELLPHAVESVMRLDDYDYEIVVSDNCSSGDVAGYVASLNDARVRYVRAPRLLSATENWNNALANCTGDYVIMLGDDDALLSDYFSRTRRLISDFAPQVIYHSALLYTYPGVMTEEPAGALQSYGYAPFLRGLEHSRRVSEKEAHSLVRRAARFRSSYGFNIQFVTVKRETITTLARGQDFFRPPFPDYYAMNYLFARANSIVAEPQPLVVIGLSARSHGYFCHHDRESEGKLFLEGEGDDEGDSRSSRAHLLPGTNINSGWLLTFEELHRQLGYPPDYRPSYRRYRMLQILHVYGGFRLRGTVDAEQMAELRSQLTRVERAIYGAFFGILSAAERVLPRQARAQIPRLPTLIARQVPWWSPVPDRGRYRDISEVVRKLDHDPDPARWKAERGSRLSRAVLRRVFA